MQAALGLAQLAKCDSMTACRTAIAARYTEELAGLEAFETPVAPVEGGHAWHLYVLQVNASALRIGRDQVIEELKHRGIGTSVHFIPLHLHSVYRDQLGYRAGQFPNAEERFERAISLPIYPGMDGADTDRVIEALHEIAREHQR
jgi:dTDP-4-amino-4,6-dideoxygalactose transaminase